MKDIRDVTLEVGDVIVTGYRQDRTDKPYDKDALEIETIKTIDIEENSILTEEGNVIGLDDTDVLVLPCDYKD